MEYYSAMRENATLPFVTTRMDLESIMPREISQTENDKNHIISLTCGMCNSKQQMNKQNKFTNTENSTMATRASRG